MSSLSNRVVVIGAGAWGTTLALVAHHAQRDVLIVSSQPATVALIRDERRHPRSLPGIVVPPEIGIEHSDHVQIGGDDIVVIAVPVQSLARSLSSLPHIGDSRVIVSAAKGIETSTLQRPSELIASRYPAAPIAVLSGPNIAGEIAAGRPATSVVASNTAGSAEIVQAALSSASFRLYTNDDVIGVELGGALKNIVAIGAGISDAVEAGHNAKAAFMTRGIGEIARLGIALGAQPLTFAGLSGIGDLIATCGSTASRNYQVGYRLGRGESLPSITSAMVETAEGVETTRAARELSIRLGVPTPIIDGMHRILFQGSSPMVEAALLMEREPTDERR